MANEIEISELIRSEESDKKELFQSIRTSVCSVALPSRNISVVPEGLKKSNEDAYIPKKVSMGPRFRESKEDLLLMEEVKLSCMRYLLFRAGNKAGKNLEQCTDAIWQLDEKVRGSYLGDIKLEKHELVKIMLVDGCFLLELLISKSEELDSQLPCWLVAQPCLASELLKDEVVLSDLMLLENQIPIFVVHKLSQTLFPKVFEVDENEEDFQFQKTIMTKKKINNLALSVLGYSPLQSPYVGSPHILDLVHSFVNTTARLDYLVQIMNPTITRPLKLKRCALRLLTSGVTLKAKLHEDNKDSTGSFGLSCFSLVWNSLCGMLFWLCNIFLVNGKHFDADHIPEDVELKGLDFYFNFENGKLEIQQLRIAKTTKAKWCNLIAWEHHKKYKYVSTPEEDRDWEKYKTVSGGKFTLAALIFNGLICSPDDVQLLKDKKIIVDHLKMSNQELMDFFRKIAFGIDHKVVDSGNYIQMVHDINNYSYKAFIIKRMWKTVWTSFTYRQEWVVRFMNHNYNFVATVLSVLAVVQTVYTILAYYYPK